MFRVINKEGKTQFIGAREECRTWVAINGRRNYTVVR